MTLRQFNSEGGTNGLAVLTTDTGSGDSFDQIDKVGSPTLVYDSSTFLSGSKSVKLVGADGDLAIMRYNGLNDYQIPERCGFCLDVANTTRQVIYKAHAASISNYQISLDTTQHLSVHDETGAVVHTFTAALTVGTWYRIEVQHNIGADSTHGQIFVQLSVGLSATVTESYSATTLNLGGGTNSTYVAWGKWSTVGALSAHFDEMAINPGTSSAIGVPSAAPTPAFTANIGGLKAYLDGSASVDSSGSAVASYAWDFGDGSTATGATASHVYTAPGPQTIKLQVTDTAGNVATLSKTVTTANPTASSHPVRLVSAPGFTVTGAPDLLTAVSDPNQATFGVAVGGGVDRWVMGAVLEQSPGTSVTVTDEADMTGATTGTVSLKVYDADGTTLRSTVAAQTLTLANPTDPTSLVASWTVPSADADTVTDWNAVQLEFTRVVS